jgi:hypothetical protein
MRIRRRSRCRDDMHNGGAQLYRYANWVDPYWRNVVVEWTFVQAVIKKRRSACEVVESNFYPWSLAYSLRVLLSYRTKMVSFVVAFVAQRSSPWRTSAFLSLSLISIQFLLSNCRLQFHSSQGESTANIQNALFMFRVRSLESEQVMIEQYVR